MTPSSPTSSRRSPASGAERSPRRAAARLAWIGAAALLCGGGALGYARIVLNGLKLGWSGATVSWRLNSAGSADIADASEEAAIVHAFQSWEDVPGSGVRFQRQGNTGSKNPDGSDHIVAFDENNASGYFPPGSGIVAITPIRYSTSNGAILDADILFNGRDYAFSTDGAPGTFDVQDVATHEIGHFIGLDHSPVVGASMWPYVSPGQWLHRSLHGDDAAGATAVEPAGGDSALRGLLRKADGSPLKGAHVVAVRAGDGRLAAAALSDEDGEFRIRGLSAGDYHVYAAPLEGAMDAGNLTGNAPVQTAFSAEFYGGFANPSLFPVAAGATTDCGALTLPAEGELLEATGAVALLRPGESRTLMVWGGGFTPGGMELSTLGPELTIGNVSSGTTWAQCTVTASLGAPIGSYDLYLRSPSGELEAVTGGIEVVAPAPVISLLETTQGGIAGGTLVRIRGSGFQDGAYVLFGGLEAPAVTFVDAGTVDALTPASDPGTVAVSVHNPDGQHARADGAFTFAAIPALASLFPTAGQTAGGTTVVINGSGFDPAIQVLFGGVPASVDWRSAKLLRVTTPARPAGPADLTLRNPSAPDLVEPAAFQYVKAADPVITGLTPTRGKRNGGARVRIRGSGLAGTLSVRFGVDPVTCQGGSSAPALEVLGDADLATVTPAWTPGSYGVLLTTASGQGALAPGTFAFLSEEGGGAGGCGGVVGGGKPRDPIGDLPSWAALVAGYWLLRRRGPRPA